MNIMTDGKRFIVEWSKCNICAGKGKIEKTPCALCGGTGKIIGQGWTVIKPCPIIIKKVTSCDLD